MSVHFIGVDVGSGSARPVFLMLPDAKRRSKADIRQFKPHGGLWEQSSDDIWRSVPSR